MHATVILLIVAVGIWFVIGPPRDRRREKRIARLRELAVAACEPRRRKIIIDTVRKTGRYFGETGMEAYRGTIIRGVLDLPFAWYDTSRWTREEKAALAEAERCLADTVAAVYQSKLAIEFSEGLTKEIIDGYVKPRPA
jgi:hypothetical protein